MIIFYCYNNMCVSVCTVRVCCYGRVNLFLCFKDCWAIFIINHVSYAEQTDIVFDSFSISFWWNVNEFHLLLSLHIKIELSTSTHKMGIENSVRMKREKSKSSPWSSNSSSSTKTRSVFMYVCLCIELSKNDIKAEYLIELKITWPQTKLCVHCARKRYSNRMFTRVELQLCGVISSSSGGRRNQNDK